MTTEITLRLPDSVIRKIRAYNILVGGDSKNFEAMLVNLIEQTVTGQIMNAVSPNLRVQYESPDPAPARQLRRLATETPLFTDDVSGISSGLGDEDKTPDEDSEPAAAEMEDPYLSDNGQSRGGGLTDEELAGDMSVGDPAHEAKAESQTFADSMNEESPEGQFAQLAGLPKPPVDQRVAKRGFSKTVKGRRARVRPMSENESESAP